MDALNILKREHTRIEQIFQEFDALPEPAHRGREALVVELHELVRRHIAMEDAMMSEQRMQQMGHDALMLQYLEDLRKMDCHDEMYVPRALVVRELLLQHVAKAMAEAG